nr:cytochrome P450 [Erythrobacter sp.]
LARKLISQALNKACIERVIQHVPRFLDQESADLTAGKTVRVGPTVRRVTMRAMCLTILGTTNDAIFENLMRRFEAATGYFANLVSYNKAFWPPGHTLSVGTEVKRRKDGIDAIIFDVIESRRAKLSKSSDEEEVGRDLLSHLLDSQSEYGYSDQFIRDNLVSTLAAGYDTTGSAITWLLFWLGKDGHSRRRLNDAYRAGSADYDAYADALVSESLRYCPPLEILPRRPAQSSDDPSATQTSEPTLVCPCPHHVHHNAAIYGDPDQFRPDRFLGRKFAPTEYFPFGLGNRLCLGIVLAPKIMRATLEWFLSRQLYLQFRKDKFRPIRRNVSLWPGFSTKATVLPMRD